MINKTQTKICSGCGSERLHEGFRESNIHIKTYIIHCIWHILEVILRQSFTCSACSVLIKILRSEKNAITQACKTRSLHLKVLRGSALCSQRHPYQAVVATISLAVLSKLFNNRRILIRSSFQARFTCLNTSAVLVYLCK